MMNVRLKLREPKGLVVPEGPGLTLPRTIKTTIDGTDILFKVPKHRPRRPCKPTLPEKIYHSDEVFFRESRNERLSVPYDWEYFELFEHAWAFYGPWFTGVRAQLDMSVRLLKPVNYTNQNLSLFHPRAFEQLVGDYLTYSHAGTISEVQGGKCYSIGPVGWQPYKRLPVVAARLNVIADETIVSPSLKHNLFFPISNQLMVLVWFYPSRLLNLPSQEERDKRVSTSTMYELMEKIIDTLQVELSPEAQAQQSAALAGLKDISLVSEYPPLDWNGEVFRRKNFKSVTGSDDE